MPLPIMLREALTLDAGCDYDLCFQCMSEQIHPITSICSDGTFLYISDALAHTISKVGSGCEGSIEGDVVKTLKGTCPHSVPRFVLTLSSCRCS